MVASAQGCVRLDKRVVQVRAGSSGAFCRERGPYIPTSSPRDDGTSTSAKEVPSSRQESRTLSLSQVASTPDRRGSRNANTCLSLLRGSESWWSRDGRS